MNDIKKAQLVLSAGRDKRADASSAERAKLDRRRRVLTNEIERLSYAIANSRRKPDELLRRIDECDLERESVEERLRLLGSGDENVIPFDHPKFRDRYLSEVGRLAPRSTPIRRRSKLVSPSAT